jgi:hypothetical protein
LVVTAVFLVIGCDSVPGDSSLVGTVFLVLLVVTLFLAGNWLGQCPW